MLNFALAVLGFALLVLFVAFVVIPLLRRGNEKAVDTFAFLESLRGWT